MVNQYNSGIPLDQAAGMDQQSSNIQHSSENGRLAWDQPGAAEQVCSVPRISCDVFNADAFLQSQSSGQTSDGAIGTVLDQRLRGVLSDGTSNAPDLGIHQLTSLPATADDATQYTFRYMWPNAILNWPVLAADAGIAEQPVRRGLPMPGGQTLYYWLPRQHDFSCWNHEDAVMFVELFRGMGIVVDWDDLDGYFPRAGHSGLAQQGPQNDGFEHLDPLPPLESLDGFTPQSRGSEQGLSSSSSFGLGLVGESALGGSEVAANNVPGLDSIQPQYSAPLGPYQPSVQPEESPRHESTETQLALPGHEESAVGENVTDDTTGLVMTHASAETQQDEAEPTEDAAGESGATPDVEAGDDLEDDEDDRQDADVQDAGAQTDDATPLEPSNKTNGVTLRFQNGQELQAFKDQHRGTPNTDPSIPTTWAAKLPHVLRAKKAMMDTTHAKDKRGTSYGKRWAGAPDKLYYDEEGVEAIAHEIVERLAELALFGPGIFNCYDPEHYKKYEAAHKTFTFQTRMDMIVELLLKSKDRVNKLMKHQGIDDVVGFPHLLVGSSDRNRDFNDNRAMQLEVAREVRKAAPGTDANQIADAVRQRRAQKLGFNAPDPQPASTDPADAEGAQPSVTENSTLPGTQSDPVNTDEGSGSQRASASSQTRTTRRNVKVPTTHQTVPALAPSGQQTASNASFGSFSLQVSGQHAISQSSSASNNMSQPAGVSSQSSVLKRPLPTSASEPAPATKRRKTRASGSNPTTQPPEPQSLIADGSASTPKNVTNMQDPLALHTLHFAQPRSRNTSDNRASDYMRLHQANPYSSSRSADDASDLLGPVPAAHSRPPNRKRRAEAEEKAPLAPERVGTRAKKTRRDRTPSPEA